MPVKPKIVYAWNYLSWGGAQIYFLGLVKLVKDHFDVHLVLPKGSDRQIVSFFEKQKVKIHTFEPSFDGQEKPGLIGKFTMHRQKVHSEKAMLKKVDEVANGQAIVHVELAPWQSLCSLVWLLLRYPVFITMHNSVAQANALRDSLWKLKLKLVSRWDNFRPFTSNKDTKAFFRGYFSKEVSERTVVTYTAVDLAEVEDALEKKLDSDFLLSKHGIQGDKKIVLALGQFIDRKGRWEFVEAAQNLAKEREDFHCVWISNLELSAADQKKLEEYDVSDCFSLLKSKEVAEEHVDLFVFLRTADVFVLPSHVEGLPISILEAMALGLPVVSTKINAIPEAIEDGKTGLLVGPRDSDSLTEAIARLLDDEKLRQQFGDEAKRVANENFSEEAVAKLALREYLKVLNG